MRFQSFIKLDQQGNGPTAQSPLIPPCSCQLSLHCLLPPPPPSSLVSWNCTFDVSWWSWFYLIVFLSVSIFRAVECRNYRCGMWSLPYHSRSYLDTVALSSHWLRNLIPSSSSDCCVQLVFLMQLLLPSMLCGTSAESSGWCAGCASGYTHSTTGFSRWLSTRNRTRVVFLGNRKRKGKTQ